MNYEHVIHGGEHTITLNLTKEAEAAILKAYDNGIEGLTPHELDLIYRQLISVVKDSIHP